MMKKSIIQNTVLGFLLVSGLVACNDAWDNHYEVKDDLNPTETLWDVISSRSELSEFTNLLKRTDYENLLKQDRYFTVWAPANGFTYSENNDSLLQAEFIENHVADFSHVASGTLADNQIKMINGKYIFFNGANGNYTFKGCPLRTRNIATKNGILHIIDGYADFTSNLWENLAKVDSLSEINKFLKSFTRAQFDRNNSVPGPIINGEQTYLDSVVIEQNEWFSRIGYLAREDSSYIMIAPTDKAWREQYEIAKQYYVYPTSKVDGDSLQDLNAKRAICDHLVFSKAENHLRPEDTSDILNQLSQFNGDSLISNYRSWPRKIFYEKKNDELSKLFDNKIEEYHLSNGSMYVVDKLNYTPLKCWHDTIKVEGENSFDIALKTSNSDVVMISRDSIELRKRIPSGMYGVFSPTTGTGNPTITATFKNVLSAPYLIKIVFIPANLIDKDVTELYPNVVTIQLEYRDAGGKKQKVTLASKVENDPTKIDTMVVSCADVKGNPWDYFRFPVNEYQLEESEETFTQLSIASVVTSRQKDKDRTLRIDKIFLEPIDAEKYDKEHAE